MNLKFLVTTLLSILIVVSCGKKDENKSETKKEETSNVLTTKKETGPLFKLKYKFKKGDKFSYRLKTISHNIEEIIADTTIKNDITQTATYKMDFRVKEVSEDGGAKLEVRMNKITAETNFNGQTVKYDSKFIYSTRERAQYMDYEAVKKVPFIIHVNPIGQVIKVDGIKKIMRNILEIQQIPDTLSPKTKEQMKLNIANGTLMPLTQQVFKVVSEETVGKDSTWQLKYSTPLAVFKVENTALFKISDINITNSDTLINIASSLSISWTGQNQVTEKGVRYNFSEPKLTGSGSVIFNQTLGLVKKSESVINLEMAMLAEGYDANNQKMQSTKKDYSTNTNIVELL